MDFDVGDLDVPFDAFNLHKWVGAPLGCGCFYIRHDSLPAIDRCFGDQDFGLDDIRWRIHTGSPYFAACSTIPAALQLHQRIGAAAKAARLRGLPGIEVLTPDEGGMAAGITAFRLQGRTTAKENDAVVAQLQASHGEFTVPRCGPVRGDCVRVTLGVQTTLAKVRGWWRAVSALVRQQAV